MNQSKDYWLRVFNQKVLNMATKNYTLKLTEKEVLQLLYALDVWEQEASLLTIDLSKEKAATTRIEKKIFKLLNE